MTDWLPMPIQPSYEGTQGTAKPRMLSSKFGDGFKQDTPDGMNPIERSFTIQWNTINSADAAKIIAFLNAHAGIPFYYRTPREIAPRTWVETGRQHSVPYPQQDSLTVQLEERFVY